jgi:putative PIN family toxin of toxin-antitoxin system
MKVTLDTNVLIAAFISRGQCHELLEHIVRHHRIVLSEHILDKIREGLSRKFKIPGSDIKEAIELLRQRAKLVEPMALGYAVSRDPDDDPVLATALAGEVACLITGDNDLLVLEQFEGIPILRPGSFWEFEAMQE